MHLPFPNVLLPTTTLYLLPTFRTHTSSTHLKKSPPKKKRDVCPPVRPRPNDLHIYSVPVADVVDDGDDNDDDDDPVPP